jgi:hypothetical protein
MPSNYILLEKITVGAAGAASVTFANIPQTGYTDLVVKSSLRATGATSGGSLTFNGVTTGYSERLLYRDGSTVLTASNSGSSIVWLFLTVPSTYTANTFSNGEIYIPNYTSSNFKSVSGDLVQENNATASDLYLTSGLWSNTAAITSMTITSGSNFAANSTFYLYGVAAFGTTPVIAPKATGGSIIDTDGTYWYHTFLSSGTFTPNTSLNCDYLVVAGGGGGGGFAYTGGGGAGGLRSTVTATGGGGSLETPLFLATNTAYTVTVGAGGAGGPTTGLYSGKGSDSVFATVTSIGGGRTAYNTAGDTGGSGGGGGSDKAGGSGTVNQGYAGGNGTTVSPGGGAGGGGGGAGAVGGNATINTSAGSGGNGVAVSISGSSVTYAGGGGGGANNSPTSTRGIGGTGGGGNGAATSVNGDAGTANSGGGGGGGFFTPATSGGAGGSGIVIVRYLVA